MLSYELPFFNPGSNYSRVSWLRLVNLADESADVAITATDDFDAPPPEGSVRVFLPRHGARMLSAQQLEGLTEADGVTGRLGDGRGKWKLRVISNRQLQVMSLMQTSSGVISNVTR